MAAIVNGLSLSKLRAFGATFFIFSDYARPAIRLSALMELPTIFVFTHDAMGDGEDGPTHQPVEQLISLRAIPGLVTLRPGDANEVVEAYRYIMQLRHKPAALVLSRQPLPTLDRGKYASAAGVSRGAYVLADAPGGKPEILLIATGSELRLTVQTHEQLSAEGIRSRVVSMPSWDIFEKQSQEYRNTVLSPEVTARVAVEQGSTVGWERYVGASGQVIGMETFGASAPLKELQKKFGFEPDRLAAAAKKLLLRKERIDRQGRRLNRDPRSDSHVQNGEILLGTGEALIDQIEGTLESVEMQLSELGEAVNDINDFETRINKLRVFTSLARYESHPQVLRPNCDPWGVGESPLTGPRYVLLDSGFHSGHTIGNGRFQLR